MKNAVDFLTGNLVLNLSILAWAMAQIIKFIITLITKRKLDWRHILSSGGMPSSHTALVCSLTIAMARKTGVSSAECALALALACIVMYDAMGVRRAAGEHAKVLNKLVFGFQLVSEESNNPEDDQIAEELGDKALKEYLGHTPLEVLGGMLLGILVAMVFPVR